MFKVGDIVKIKTGLPFGLRTKLNLDIPAEMKAYEGEVVTITSVNPPSYTVKSNIYRTNKTSYWWWDDSCLDLHNPCDIPNPFVKELPVFSKYEYVEAVDDWKGSPLNGFVIDVNDSLVTLKLENAITYVHKSWLKKVNLNEAV